MKNLKKKLSRLKNKKLSNLKAKKSKINSVIHSIKILTISRLIINNIEVKNNKILDKIFLLNIKKIHKKRNPMFGCG